MSKDDLILEVHGLNGGYGRGQCFSTWRCARRGGAVSPSSVATAPAKPPVKDIGRRVKGYVWRDHAGRNVGDPYRHREAHPPRSWLCAARARGFRQADGARESRPRRHQPARPNGGRRGLGFFPRVGRTLGAAGRHAVGRRAQDAGHRPRCWANPRCSCWTNRPRACGSG